MILAPRADSPPVRLYIFLPASRAQTVDLATASNEQPFFAGGESLCALGLLQFF
jgi:hypothetical protein